MTFECRSEWQAFCIQQWATPSGNTGPSKPLDGYFAYIEASARTTGDNAILSSAATSHFSLSGMLTYLLWPLSQLFVWGIQQTLPFAHKLHVAPLCQSWTLAYTVTVQQVYQSFDFLTPDCTHESRGRLVILLSWVQKFMHVMTSGIFKVWKLSFLKRCRQWELAMLNIFHKKGNPMHV